MNIKRGESDGILPSCSESSPPGEDFLANQENTTAKIIEGECGAFSESSPPGEDFLANQENTTAKIIEGECGAFSESSPPGDDLLHKRTRLVLSSAMYSVVKVDQHV